MAGIFKAYDVRGVYPDQLNEDLARSIGLAYQHVLDDSDRACGNTIIVGRDMRASSVPLAEALIDGLNAAGLDVLDIGLVTTPMNYFAIGSIGAAGGVQVTASHNPGRYNGLKFSRHGARPVSGESGIGLMERSIANGDLPIAETRGSHRHTDIFEAYGEHVLGHLARPADARRLKVAVDAANGMGTIYKPLLERLGIDLVPLYFELDGTFPNHEANPLKLENLRDLSELVRTTGADLGICFDGDADRAAFVDETGEPVGSDLSTALIAGELLEREPGAAIIYDLRSSRAVAEYISEHGGVPVRERVGHSFIKATLRERNSPFGGELAGHYYFRDNFTADNSLMAVIEILNLMWKSGETLSELAGRVLRYSKSPEVNFEVEDKDGKIAELEERYHDGEIDRLDGITVQYPDWWFNVRPSNTEPYLRLVVEASSPAALEERLGELQGLLGTPAD